MPHLEMKDRCEKCGQRISSDSEAYICSYECTFCSVCTSQMSNFCPNCGGELVRRPNRGNLGPANSNGANPITPPSKRVWLVCLTSIAAWMFIALSGGISLYEVDRSLGYPHSVRMEFVLPLVNYLIFAFLTPFVFFLARRNPIQRNNW